MGIWKSAVEARLFSTDSMLEPTGVHDFEFRCFMILACASFAEPLDGLLRNVTASSNSVMNDLWVACIDAIMSDNGLSHMKTIFRLQADAISSTRCNNDATSSLKKASSVVCELLYMLKCFRSAQVSLDM